MARKPRKALGSRFKIDQSLVDDVLNSPKQRINKKPTSALGRGLELDESLVKDVLTPQKEQLQYAAGLIIQGAKNNILFDIDGTMLYDLNPLLDKIRIAKNKVQKNYNRTDNGYRVHITERQIARAIFQSIIDRKLPPKVNTGTLKIMHDIEPTSLNRISFNNLTEATINKLVQVAANKIEAILIMFEDIDNLKSVIEALLDLTPDAMGTRSV